jgi:DNA invertase Pin-like site-specific DNA recombinase
MFAMIGAFAEFERSIIRERVQSGLDQRKSELESKGFFISKRGKRRDHLGRKARTDVDVTLIRKLRADGLSWRGIEAKTGIPQATCRDRCGSIAMETPVST